jgi:hypothetical protein
MKSSNEQFQEVNHQKNCRVFIEKRGIPKKYFILKTEKMEKKLKSKDLSINSQSGLKFVLDYLKYRGISDVTLNEIFRITDVVTEYTMFEKDADFKVKLKALDGWLNSKTKIIPNEIGFK